jgi:predicted metalloprotease with PDZ domain
VSRGPSALAVDFEFAATPVADLFSFIAATHGNPLGVEVAPVDKALSAQLGLPAKNGVVVTRVAAAADAAKTGLAQHDVVLKIGDRAVTNPEKFNELIKAEPGKELQFQIVRQGKPLTLGVHVPQTPVYEVATNELFAHVTQDNQYRVGVTLAPADDTLRSQLRLASGEGLVVTDIVSDGPAAKAGVKKHDVLTLLDGKRLTTVDAINSQVQSIKDRKVTVVFFRGGQEMSRELAPKLGTAPVTARLSGITYENSFLQQLQNPNVVWHNPAFSYNLEGATGTISFTQPHVHWAASNTAVAAKPAAPAEQIASLKKQLAEMQKTLQSLEAALQPPAAPDKQPAAAPKTK